MNDFLVDEIYKNTQRLRVKNQIQEKLLYQMIEGHKGFREKLNKTLSKIEKTRQIIEQEYFFMEREMRCLGLSPRQKKLTATTATLHNIPPSPRKSSQIDPNETNNQSIDSTGSDSQDSSDTSDNNNNKDPVICIDDDINEDSKMEVFTNKSNSIIEETPKIINNISNNNKKVNIPTARRLSTIGMITNGGKSTNSYSNLNFNSKRKYSLDSHRLLPVNNSTSSSQTANFIKSLRRSNIVLIDSNQSLNDSKPDVVIKNDTSKINESTILHTEPSYLSIYSPPSKADSDFYTVSLTKPSTNQSARTIYSFNNRNNQSARTNCSNFTAASTNTFRRASLGSNSSVQLPRLPRRSGSFSKPSGYDDSKRRVSFGQIELTQLEIPQVYKYSNIGYERYKLNPHFYLPDGSLKRKFSLPKLSDTIEAMRNCRYLRTYSTESPDITDVKNIFNDIEPNPSEMKNFDIILPKNNSNHE